MTWIRTIAPAESQGLLQGIYAASLKRAGKVFQIVRAMSLAPRVLESSLQLYREVMFAASGLSRRQRELLAVVVSCCNRCHY